MPSAPPLRSTFARCPGPACNVKKDTPNVLQPGEPALLGNSPGFSGAFLFGMASFGPLLDRDRRDR